MLWILDPVHGGGYVITVRKWIRSVRGEHVAFTGAAWRKRQELQNSVRRLGGEPTRRGAVNSKTTILVRGKWEHDNYGSKEELVAQLIRAGREIAVVSDSEFRKLLVACRREFVTALER